MVRALLLMTAVGTLALGCTSTRPYVTSDVKAPISLAPSSAHTFDSVDVSQDDGQLIVYGRVEHMHDHCPNDGHVDLAVVAKDGKVLHTASMVLAQRGRRGHGAWFSAHFRHRVAMALPDGASVRLAVHDDGCVGRDVVWDCGANRAVVGPDN